MKQTKKRLISETKQHTRRQNMFHLMMDLQMNKWVMTDRIQWVSIKAHYYRTYSGKILVFL